MSFIDEFSPEPRDAIEMWNRAYLQKINRFPYFDPVNSPEVNSWLDLACSSNPEETTRPLNCVTPTLAGSFWRLSFLPQLNLL